MPDHAHLCQISAVEVQKSTGQVDVWCGLDEGRVIMYELEGNAEASLKPSTDGSAFSLKQDLRIPYCDSQPASYICITQHESLEINREPNAGRSPSVVTTTSVWAAMRRRSVLSCWTYGNVLWTKFDLAMYLSGVECK